MISEVEAEAAIIGDAVMHLGDCRVQMAGMAPEGVDAIVTDPPYGLSFMGKGWDYGVPGLEFWQEAQRVLKPGGHLLAFGGTRTFHRQTCAIEDAGLEIRDCVMWVYGSGFPKSLDVSKAIDKARNSGREEILKCTTWIADRCDALAGEVIGFDQRSSAERERRDIPATEAAREWEGWGTALKPAWEPVIVARKPLVGTVAANVLQHGTGALNIDGCRVATGDALGGGAESASTKKEMHEGWDRPWMHDTEAREAQAQRIRDNVQKAEALGRWPANLIHDGSDEVVACFPCNDTGAHGGTGEFTQHAWMGGLMPTQQMIERSSGSAARFFYCAKASKADRDGLTEQFLNKHPTVKPTALMRYLCRLVTPPDGVVLDPFAGSGSTGVAAIAEGFRFIGIEMEQDSFNTAQERLRNAQKQHRLL